MSWTEEPQRNRWWLVVAAGIAVFMAQADVTVVHVALPTIGAEFGISAGLTQWVVLGYVLPMVALSLPAGRWLDQMGQREALVGSLAGFALASLAAGLAQNFAWLITARVAQGAFGAVLFALLPVLATTAVRRDARGRAMAIVMTLGPLGAVSGPALGGLLIDTVGWPWIFFINLPVSLVVTAIAFAQLAPGAMPRWPGRDWLAEAAVLSGAGAALILSLSLTATHDPLWLALALAALPFLYVWRRLASSAPVRELLGTPGMRGPHAALLAQMAAVMAAQFLIPFFLHRVAGATPTTVGLTMLAFPAAMMAGGVIGGPIADRCAPRPVAVAGAAIIAFGVALLVPLGGAWEPLDLAWRLAVAGFGSGLFAGQNQVLAMGRAPAHLMATTGATTSLARQLGLALGPALATAVWTLSGEGTAGMSLALGLAAALGALSALALARRAAQPEAAQAAPARASGRG